MIAHVTTWVSERYVELHVHNSPVDFIRNITIRMIFKHKKHLHIQLFSLYGIFQAVITLSAFKAIYVTAYQQSCRFMMLPVKRCLPLLSRGAQPVIFRFFSIFYVIPYIAQTGILGLWSDLSRTRTLYANVASRIFATSSA